MSAGVTRRGRVVSAYGSRSGDAVGGALAASLASGRWPPGGGTRFFEPTPAFIAWATAEARGRLIYDVGAGVGHVAAALARAGLAVSAVEMAPPAHVEFRADVADGGAYAYEPGSVVMLCRPCHAGFPERVVGQAGRRGAAVWYVGLDRNVAEDLGDARGFSVALRDAGEAGEHVRVKKERRVSVMIDLLNVALVDWGCGPQWCRDDGGDWVNTNRGRCPKGRKDVVAERREGVTRREWLVLEDERNRAAWKVQREGIMRDVAAQAKGVTIELCDKAGAVVATVPRAPFVQWALYRTTLAHLAPPWTPVSPSGLRLASDSPFHSDWYFGAGFDAPNGGWSPAYEAIQSAANRAAAAVQRELGNFQCHVIVGGAPVSGVVGVDIAVLPDLGRDRVPEMLAARAVITEAGGVGAHLASIGRERSVPIVRIEGARKLFVPGMFVTVDGDDGTVQATASARKEPTP